MTMREIHVALKRIDTRKHNQYAMQAALHGHKLKIRPPAGDSVKSQQFTDEEQAAMDRAMNKAVQRNKMNHAFKQHGRR